MRRALLLALVPLALYLAWYHETRWPVRSAQDPPQTLIVEPGWSVLEIGRRLQGLGLARHPEIFRVVVMRKGATAKLRAGEYSFEGQMSLEQIVDKMVRGDVVRHAVTFPEGKNIEEMAALAAAQGIPAAAFQAAARDAALIRDLDPEAEDLEGYVFPDTYDISPRRPDAASDLVARGVRRFREVIAPDLPRLPKLDLTLREAITLASLVELETAVGEERPRIAAVFLNRLKRRMPLQTDPTVIYALRKGGAWDGNIRKGDLEIDSSYNTYRYAGLPPGPIASPGRASLRAVFEPAPVADLYFVSRNDGTHHFSATLEEHARAVNYYQRNRGLVPPEPSPGGPSPLLLPPPAVTAPLVETPAPFATPPSLGTPFPRASPSPAPTSPGARRRS